MLFRVGVVFAFVQAAAIQAQSPGCSALEMQAGDAMRRREYQAAAQRYREALDACPGNRSFKLELARAYLMAGRIKEAIAESGKILGDFPDEPAALKIKGNAAYLLGDFSTAKDTFIRLLERHPSDEEGAYMLGRIYYHDGNIDLAIGQFERVRKINPAHYKALDNLGLCYQAQGDDEAAKRYFLAAIQLVETNHPEYDWPYTNLSDLLLKSGDAQRAFDAAAKAANRNPLSARSFYAGAKALDRLGKTELALNWLQRAVSLDAESSDSWYLLSRLYRKAGQTDKAEEAQQKFRELKAKESARAK